MKYAKAVVAGIVALAGTAAVASVGGWTEPEIWGVVGTTVAAAGAVFGIRNEPQD